MIVFSLNLIRWKDSKIRKPLKNFFSEYNADYISTNLVELIHEISVMIIDKKTDVGNDPILVRNHRDKERETIDKFNELPNSVLNILVERSNVVFYAQDFLFKIRFCTQSIILTFSFCFCS